MSEAEHHLKCEITEETSQSFLPPLPEHANCFQKLWRNWKKSILISERNPRCGHYYRTATEVLQIREELVKSKKCLIIHPFSPFRLWYEFYMAFIFLLCLLYMPFDAAFDRHTANLGFLIMGGCVNVMCFTDIVLRFHTGVVDKKERSVILERKKIAKRYLLSLHFYTDVLSSLPDAAMFTSSATAMKVMDTLLMLKIFRIKTMFDYFTRMAEYFHVKNGYFDAGRFLLLICLTLHWLGCIMYLVPQFRKSFTGSFHRYSWMISWNLLHIPETDRYIICLYRAAGCVLGIRLETKAVKALEEVIMICFFYAFGKVLCCTLLVILVQRLITIRSFETKYQEIIEQVKGFISSHHLPPNIMEKLLLLYQYKYHGTYFNEDKIKQLLSESLKKEVNAQALSRLRETVAMFSELPEEKLLDLLSQLHCEIYLPQDVIIKAGAVGDCMYFIASGTVSVLTPSGKEVCHLYDGAYFGEICLLLKDRTKRTANVIALEICEVYKLSGRGFKNCLKDQKELRKKLETASMARIEMTQAYEDLHKGAFMDLTR